MANLDSNFKDFYKDIQIPESKINSMITSRNNLRNKIKDYFIENHPEY